MGPPASDWCWTRCPPLLGLLAQQQQGASSGVLLCDARARVLAGKGPCWRCQGIQVFQGTRSLASSYLYHHHDANQWLSLLTVGQSGASCLSERDTSNPSPKHAAKLDLGSGGPLAGRQTGVSPPPRWAGLLCLSRPGGERVPEVGGRWETTRRVDGRPGRPGGGSRSAAPTTTRTCPSHASGTCCCCGGSGD